MYAPSGYTTRHDPGKCKLCGECVKACNFGAVEMVDGRRVYRPERCYGCELCVENCPNGALELVLEEGGLIPLDMELLREKLG